MPDTAVPHSNHTEMAPGRVTIFRLIRDHVRRTLKAADGFSCFGIRWIEPWLAYLVSPLLSRLFKRAVWRFRLFSARLGECDLYTFANLFEDYQPDKLAKAIETVDLVVDAGANVGAFSFLALTMAKRTGVPLRVIAVEPERSNVAFLKQQPFARSLEVLHAAVGPESGSGILVPGTNSVTGTVDFSGPGELSGSGAKISVLSVEELCGRPTLLKLDIEGGEYEILKRGLPQSVRAMFLEWHPSATDGRPASPVEFVPYGEWVLLSRDEYGCSCWFWTAEQLRVADGR